MALSSLVRQRLAQNFGITTDEYNASQELANAVDASSANGSIVVLTSVTGSGGLGASFAITVTGLLATDTVMSVSQKTAGANTLPLLGWTTVANNTLTVQYSAEPGAGTVLVVSVKR